MVAVDLQAVHDFLIQIAHEAGTMILTAKPVAAGSGTKKNSADLVSETDQAVEKMVSTRLKAKYPDFECDILLSYSPPPRRSPRRYRRRGREGGRRGSSSAR